MSGPRATILTVAALASAAVLTGCGGGGGDGECAAVLARSCAEPTGSREPTGTTNGAGCVGEPGDESLLQGQPHDLPDGSGAGIGSVDLDAQPPSVRLVLADVPAAQRDQDNELTVGDSIDIGDSTWTVTQICPDTVDLSVHR